ncbi:MAG: hypothetical protein PHG69_00670 [Candidatus Omnitrophica bacterium]|nr:hypothetical protein [Candidatus Omnitrophota bacterium]
MYRTLENKAQITLFLVAALAIISLGIAGFYFISYTYEKKNSKELESQLAIVEGEKNKLEKQIDEVIKEKSALEEKVKENERLVPELQEKLVAETQAKELLLGEHEGLQGEIIKLKQERQDVKVALDIKTQEATQLQSRLNALILERDALRARITKVSSAEGQNEGEDLAKIVVKPGTFKQTKPALSTEVLLVNKEYGFVVLNAGKPEGIALKDVFEILHKGASLGFVRVEKIHDTISAADFLEGFKKNKVSEGDSANRVN